MSDRRFITCWVCGQRHPYLRLNLTIVCDCGNRISRMHQIALVSQGESTPTFPKEEQS